MTTMPREMSRSTAMRSSIATTLGRVLLWPMVSLLITGAAHFTLEAIWPDLRTFFTPAVLAPLLLAYGAWTGYRAVASGANILTAFVAAAILGLLPVALDIVGFGVILGRGVDAGVLSGVFGFAVIIFGSLVGAGFALSGETLRMDGRRD